MKRFFYSGFVFRNNVKNAILFIIKFTNVMITEEDSS